MNANTFGNHVLLTLSTMKTTKLKDLNSFLRFSEKIIDENELAIVGIATHLFDTEGYTAAICLRESHICVHTWPELNSLTLDIYLCNYQNNNEKKVKKISEEYITFFEGTIIKHHEIKR